MKEFQSLGELSPALQAELSTHLRPGETLAWAGQPTGTELVPASSQRAVRSVGIFFFVMAAVTVAAIAGMERDDGTGITVLLVLCGIGFMCTPLWVARWASRRLYAITSQRALRLDGRLGGPFHLKSFEATVLAQAKMRQQKDGSGDLIFSAQRYHDEDGESGVIEEAFRRLPDVAAKMRLIEHAAGQARPSSRTSGSTLH